nr:ATP-binding protein [Phocaeicola sartorii]
MVAILFHERNRVHEIKNEMLEIKNLQHDVSAIHRHITILSTHGETAVGWDEKNIADYRSLRLRVDSMLNGMSDKYNEFANKEQIDTLRLLLADKEAHLCQFMQLFRKHEESESAMFNSLLSASRPRTVIRKKKGIAGFFGAKEEVQIHPPASTTLQSLNTQLHSLQQERMKSIKLHADSLRSYNKNLNRKLRTLITTLDNQTGNVINARERQLRTSYDRSLLITTWLIIAAIIFLAVSYLIILHDLKQKAQNKKKMEKLIEDLHQSVRQNKELIASRKKAVHTITHELRTPLTAITGYAGLMWKEHNDGKTGQYIHNIRQSSDRMRDMLNTLLDFFRLDNNKEQPRLSPCRISAIVHTLETTFMPVAMNKGLSLTVKNGSDAVVLTDKERIIQIGNNLLSNAIKFTEEGSVSLTTNYNNGVLTLVVEDTGTGMTEDERQCIFGAFERLSNAAAKDGFGLGLAIVHNIVTMLHGTIQLESKKGKGSRFTVEIPMSKAEEVTGKEIPTYIHRKDRNLNVVAIDNDEVLLLMLKEMYAQEGIHCDTSTDAAELMEMIRRKTYNLLLTDLNMPSINGFELLELLRSSNVGNSQTIPVVVATASGSCDAEELLSRGFAGCLFKPFSISELMEVSDKCAVKVTSDEKPDFSALLSYGNEVVMLEKLITETEKEMQAVRDEAKRNDLQELDALIHHLRSSWEILRADRPLRELYRVLHNGVTPDDNTIQQAVNSVFDKGVEIVQCAKEEKRKYENG